MKRVFLIAAAVVLLWGCGSHDNTAEGRLHSLLAETHEKAEQDNGNPSDIVEVRISYFRDGEVVSQACRGFIMDTHSPLINNVGIILGTTDKTLLSVPFVASFPTERKKSTFTCIVFPKYVHIFDHVTEDGTDCYILSTATSAEGRNRPGRVCGRYQALSVRAFDDPAAGRRIRSEPSREKRRGSGHIMSPNTLRPMQ